MSLRRRIAALAAVALAGPAIVAGLKTGQRLRPAPALRITFLDVGQGDATVIRTPSGRTLLVDAGRADLERSRGRTVVLPFLRRQGIHALDAVVLTHWDQDHAGGADAVLSGIRSFRLILSPMSRRHEPPTATERRTLLIAKRTRATVWRMARGQTLRSGDGVTIAVLNPPRNALYRNSRDNNGSLVLRVSFGRRSFLLTGDAEEEAETNMLRAGLALRSDVLKVGHHGSASGTSARWLEVVRPTHAVISVGRRNPFGHPSRDVLDRMRRRQIRIWRTDQQGTITMTTDGSGLRVHTHGR